MLDSIKKIDKKIIIMFGFIFGIIILFVIIIVVMMLVGGGSSSYSSIESKLISAGKSYYKDNDGDLPTEIGDSSEVDATTLASGGYMKDLSEYVDDDVVCSGKAIVYKTESDYDYVASLDCGDEYKTTFLADKLIEESVVTNGDGLYSLDDVVSSSSDLGYDSDGYDLSSNELMSGYIYRGENVDNYIELDGTLYRIVKIDGNKDFTVLSTYLKTKSAYDDRYNADVENNYGINDYTISRAYEKLTSVYDNLEDDSIIKEKGTIKNICVGGRSDDDTDTSGSIECSSVMKDQAYSLLPMFDIMNVSLSDGCYQTTSKECQNYNYLFSDSMSFWSLTPSTESSYQSYYVSSDGIISAQRTNRSYTLKYTYFLSNRLIYVSGTGTESDPYIVK